MGHVKFLFHLPTRSPHAFLWQKTWSSTFFFRVSRRIILLFLGSCGCHFFFFGPLGAFRSCLQAFFVRFVFRRIFYLVFRLSWTLPEGPKSGFRFGESTIFVFFDALIWAFFLRPPGAPWGPILAEISSWGRPRRLQTSHALLFFVLEGLWNFYF